MSPFFYERPFFELYFVIISTKIPLGERWCRSTKGVCLEVCPWDLGSQSRREYIQGLGRMLRVACQSEWRSSTEEVYLSHEPRLNRCLALYTENLKHYNREERVIKCNKCTITYVNRCLCIDGKASSDHRPAFLGEVEHVSLLPS